DLNIYPTLFAERIALAAGLRNALVHEYDTVDQQLVHKSIKEAITEFNDYAKYILAYLETI
ncbi:MAG: hypothetical protein ACD_21C00148G0001, partial [uncultured bacterium]